MEDAGGHLANSSPARGRYKAAQLLGLAKVPAIVLGLATKPLAIGSLSRSIAITGMLVLAPFAA
jgi:hypothetical protein